MTALHPDPIQALKKPCCAGHNEHTTPQDTAWPVKDIGLSPTLPLTLH